MTRQDDGHAHYNTTQSAASRYGDEVLSWRDTSCLLSTYALSDWLEILNYDVTEISKPITKLLSFPQLITHILEITFSSYFCWTFNCRFINSNQQQSDQFIPTLSRHDKTNVCKRSSLFIWKAPQLRVLWRWQFGSVAQTDTTLDLYTSIDESETFSYWTPQNFMWKVKVRT